jgi:hypothetical protein
MYEVFRGPSAVRLKLIQTGDFEFDVFVCYSARDKDWVANHLQPALEGKLKLKVPAVNPLNVSMFMLVVNWPGLIYSLLLSTLLEL